MKMSQPLRVDYPQGYSSFVTRRFRDSELLYTKNQSLEERVLGAYGKYLSKYKARIHALTLFGSHDHAFLSFKDGTKSNFFRDLGARTAEAVKKFIPGYGTGGVFERRPSEQAITPDHESHLDRLMYTVLQPILAGITKNLSEYEGFNSFKYILSGEPLKVEFFRGADFKRAKSRNKHADPKDFTEQYNIFFEKIPGCEHMTQKEYRKYLLKEFELRRKKIIAEYDAKGHVWSSSRKAIKKARNPKRSERHSKRPLVLTICMLARKEFLNWYFSLLVQYKKASSAYLAGNSLSTFPPGTLKPPGPFVHA